MKRFKNILYAAESGIVPKAFHNAISLAVKNNARLTVILVLEPIPPYLNRLTPQMLRQVRIKETEAALDRLRESVAGRVEIETKIIEGKPFLEIIREVLRNGRDLVVKSAEGNDSALDRLFGTTETHLLRKCPCPVWLIKSSEPAPVRHIMACVDFNEFEPSDQDTSGPLNRIILEMAGSLAYSERSEFHIVHAWEAIAESVMSSGRTGLEAIEVESYLNDVHRAHRNWFDRLLRGARKWIGAEIYDVAKPRTHMPKGRASCAIPMLARRLKIDLIVMGTVARTGIPGLILGNTAEGILNAIDCSVLAVKPPGFVTPVNLEE